MPTLVAYLNGRLEDRLRQIAAVATAAQRRGYPFSVFNGLSNALASKLSAGMRNIVPFAETAWPAIPPSDAKKPTRTVRESGLHDSFLADDIVLCVGSFKSEPIYEDLVRDLFKEPPLTFPSVANDIQRMLKSSFFVHFEGVALADLESAVENHAERPTITLFCRDVRATATMVSEIPATFIFFPDGDRPAALQLMGLTRGSLPGIERSDLACWGEIMRYDERSH